MKLPSLPGVVSGVRDRFTSHGSSPVRAADVPRPEPDDSPGLPMPLALQGVIELLAVAVVGVALTRAGRRPVAAPAAVVWGLLWIAVGRATDAPSSPVVATAAATVAAVIVLATLFAVLRPPRRLEDGHGPAGVRPSDGGAR